MIGRGYLIGLGFLCLFCRPVRGQQIVLTPVFKNFAFTHPVDFQTPPDGSGRVMIVTQPGVIYTMTSGAVTTQQVMLDLRGVVTSSSSELGLLGLAFDPQFKVNGFIYVDYTAANPLRTVIARYTMSPGSDSARAASKLVLLEIAQPFENHNGGCLAFGPDGYLYIGMGDGGSGGDPFNNAQNKLSLLGKILRLDVSGQAGGKNYRIPPDNPFVNDTLHAAPELFAYGLRNPWRFSFDPVSKKLWVGDVGQDKYEEIDTVVRGRNYGWRTMEGTHCYNPSSGCNQTGLELPVYDYPHATGGGWCITGGYVYRGKAVPTLYGKYIFADYVAATLWALSLDAQGNAVREVLVPNAGSIVSFGVDADNELYACTYDGKIFRVDKGTTARTEEENAVNDFHLDQNFPNPFNGGTVLTFSVGATAYTTLVVYDMVGRQVARLVDETLQPGPHSVRWSPQGAASGMYMCRLTAGTQTTVRQIVYQK